MTDSKHKYINESDYKNLGDTYNQRKDEKYYDVGEGLVLCFYNQYKNKENEPTLETKHDYESINKLFDKKNLKFSSSKTKVIGLPDKSCEEMEKILDAFQSGDLKECRSQCGLDDSDDLKTLNEYKFLMIFFSGHGCSRGFPTNVKGDGKETMSESRCDFFMDSNEVEVPTQFLIDYVADKFQERMPKKPKVLFLDCCRNDFGKEKEDREATSSKSIALKSVEHVDEGEANKQHQSGHYYVVQATLPNQGASDKITATAIFCEIAGLKGGNRGSTHKSVMGFDSIIEKTREELLKISEQDFQFVDINKCLVKKFYLGDIGSTSGKY